MSGALAESTLEAVDLQHHRWILESVNGEALQQGEADRIIPELDFGEQMHVSGNTGCNRFNGKAVLRDGFFFVESVASTRRLCEPAQNDLERVLLTIFSDGSRISLGAEKNLTLESASGLLGFRLQDLVK